MNVPWRFTWAAVLVLAGVLGLVVACGEDEVEVVAPAATATSRPVAAEPTAVPPTEVPAATGPSGELVIGVQGLPPLIQLPSKDAPGTVGGFGVWWNIHEPIVSAKIMPPKTNPPVDEYVPSITESWTVAPDQTSITFKVRQGIPWHTGFGDFGDVTAEDIVWTFNNSFEEGSTGNGGEQLPPGHKVGWDVEDEYTAVMNVKPGEFDPSWGVLHGGNFMQSFGIVSKKAFDELGEEKFIKSPIGTGPFEATKWSGNDEVVAEAIVDHWRKIPGVATMRIVEMPELATREAALRSKEVDIAAIPPKALTGVIADTGADVVYIGIPNPNTIYMSGNYWGQTCDTCDPKEVYRQWPGFLDAIEKGYPWVGDPDDADSMENARKVRWAMSMAIDRQQIIDTILGGFSDPVYGALHPQFPPGSPNFNEDWHVEFDPVKAKQWMTEAGYADGFEVDFWSAPDYAFWDPEIADAVGEMWREHLGLDVTVDHSPYASRRPETVEKTMNIPWLHGWGMFPGGSKANFYCAHPGHLGGVTLPDDICEVGFRNDTEPDLQKRIQNNVELQDYMSFWQLQIGIATIENTWAYLPRVKNWTPYYTSAGDFNNPETITLED